VLYSVNYISLKILLLSCDCSTGSTIGYVIVKFKNPCQIHHTMANRKKEKSEKSVMAKTLTAKVLKKTENNNLSKIKDFEIIKKDYDITEENLNSNAILHKMSEILEFYLKLIQQILQPEEFHALYESNAFDDAYKMKLFDLYKRIIIAHRELLKAVILNDDKNSASTIQFVHEEIKDVKPQMLDIINKMQQSWKNESSKDMHMGPKQYFG